MEGLALALLPLLWHMAEHLRYMTSYAMYVMQLGQWRRELANHICRHIHKSSTPRLKD